jgi:hypothetical protein
VSISAHALMLRLLLFLRIAQGVLKRHPNDIDTRSPAIRCKSASCQLSWVVAMAENASLKQRLASLSEHEMGLQKYQAFATNSIRSNAIYAGSEHFDGGALLPVLMEAAKRKNRSYGVKAKGD